MANLISPFENEDWTLTDPSPPFFAEYDDDPTHRGSAKSLRLRGENGLLSGKRIGEAQSPTMVVVAGAEYDVQLWLRFDVDTFTQFKFIVQHYPNGIAMSRATVGLVSSQDFPKDVWTQFKYTITSSSTTNALYLAPQIIGSDGDFVGVIQWHTDSVVFSGAGVAVKLAERAVTGLDTLLKAQLATELGAIDTDRGDGITMAVPASGDYHHYDKQVAVTGPGTPEIHIFEDDFEFLNPYTDAGAQRAVYELPISVRVVWWNRDGDTRADMETRSRRYLTGMFNVLNKDNTLGDSDDATQTVVATDVTGGQFTEDSERNLLKGEATLRCNVRCEETQA